MLLQNIWRRVVGNVLIDNSPSTTFLIRLLPTQYHQNCEADFDRCEHYKGLTLMLVVAKSVSTT